MGRKKIDEADLKRLWGRAAGRCALCGNDLLPLLGSKPDVIGEMAHVIGGNFKTSMRWVREVI